MRTSSDTLSGIAQSLIPYYQDINEYDEKAIDKFVSDKNLLMQLRDLIDGINDWNLDSIESSLTNFQAENNLSTPAVNQPIRIALTGSTKSPGLGLTLTLFSKKTVLERMDKLLDKKS